MSKKKGGKYNEVLKNENIALSYIAKKKNPY